MVGAAGSAFGVRTSTVYTVLGSSLRNITLSADEKVIERARERARAERSTLNEQFRRWLERYAAQNSQAETYDGLMRRLGHARTGRRFTRDEANER